MGRRVERAISNRPPFSIMCVLRSVNLTHLITDVTPPRRILSAYSVNAVNLEIGYSMSEVGDSGFEGCGVMKNERPGAV